MPTFQYRAKELSGNTIEGTIEAESHDEAIEKVNRLGYLPMRVEEAGPRAKEGRSTPAAPASSIGKIRFREMTVFGQQLSTLLRSGVPLLQALSMIAEPSENAHFKDLLTQIRNEINKGAHLSAALAQYPRLFSPLYLALVSAGESSGNLDQTLARITEYRQKQDETLSRIRSAMAYPIIMALTGVGTIVFMLTFVMPRLMGIFSSMGGSLPLPTKILIQVSTSLRDGWFWMLGVGLLFPVLFRVTKRTKAQRLMLSLLKLRMPLIGSFTLKSEIARFSRTMELLLKSGISILKAIEVTAPVVTNEVLKKSLSGCLQDLREGGSFGKSLKKTKLFPLFMTNLIILGEGSGKLDEALTEIATFYERETDEAIRTLTSLLEPLMIIVMGLVVGFIVIAMLLPMFELNLMVK